MGNPGLYWSNQLPYKTADLCHGKVLLPMHRPRNRRFSWYQDLGQYFHSTAREPNGTLPRNSRSLETEGTQLLPYMSFQAWSGSKYAQMENPDHVLRPPQAICSNFDVSCVSTGDL